MPYNRFAINAVGFLFTICTVCAVAQQETNTTSLENEAQQLIQKFIGELKPTLQKAIAEGDPANAIEVCAEQAPAIAAQLSEESGWGIKRVSLKARNHTSAIPDAWERTVLEYFNQQQRAGHSAADLNYSEKINQRYRYLQAQGVEALCLLCHGTNLSTDVTQALARWYPQDKAIGYQLGEVRGGISLTRQLID